MTELSEKKCKPCEGGVEPLSSEESKNLLSKVSNWGLSINHNSISRTIVFNNFKNAISFVTKIASIAEEEGHHPDINIHKYKNVTITLSTHAINGLSENDFIVASKIDGILE